MPSLSGKLFSLRPHNLWLALLTCGAPDHNVFGTVGDAESGAELKKKIWEHAEIAHNDMLVGMSEMDKAELEARIDAMIEMQGG